MLIILHDRYILSISALLKTHDHALYLTPLLPCQIPSYLFRSTLLKRGIHNEDTNISILSPLASLLLSFS